MKTLRSLLGALLLATTCLSSPAMAQTPTTNNFTTQGFMWNDDPRVVNSLQPADINQPGGPAEAGDTGNTISPLGDLTGATDSAASIAAAVTRSNASGAVLKIDAGTLQLSTDVFFGPAAIRTDNVSMGAPLGQRIQNSPLLGPATGGGLLKYQHLMPSGPGNIYTLDYLGKSYDSSWNGYDNVYQQVSVAQQNGTTAAVVASAPWGVMNSYTGNSVWPLNNACFVYINNGNVCDGQESDVGTVAPIAAAGLGSVVGNLLTISSTTSGTFWPGQTLTGSGVTSTIITGFGPSANTFTVLVSQTVAAGTALVGTGTPAHTYGVDVHGFGNQTNYIGYRLAGNSAGAAFSYGFFFAPHAVQVGGTMVLADGSLNPGFGIDFSQGISFIHSEWSSPNLFLGPTITANGGWNGATGARPAFTASAVASGNPVPSLYPELGTGETDSDFGILATAGGTIRLRTGTLAAPVDQMLILPTPGATSQMTVTGGTTSTGPTFGSTNASMNLAGTINTGAMRIGLVGSSNYWQPSGAASGSSPVMTCGGLSDVNVSCTFDTKGTGAFSFNTGANGTGFLISDPGAVTTSRLTVVGGTATKNPELLLNGLANIQLGVGTAIPVAATTGYVLFPATAGTLTGTPQFAGLGACAIVPDTTDLKLEVHCGTVTFHVTGTTGL